MRQKVTLLVPPYRAGTALRRRRPGLVKHPRCRLTLRIRPMARQTVPSRIPRKPPPQPAASKQPRRQRPRNRAPGMGHRTTALPAPHQTRQVHREQPHRTGRWEREGVPRTTQERALQRLLRQRRNVRVTPLIQGRPPVRAMPSAEPLHQHGQRLAVRHRGRRLPRTKPLPVLPQLPLCPPLMSRPPSRRTFIPRAKPPVRRRAQANGETRLLGHLQVPPQPSVPRVQPHPPLSHLPLRGRWPPHRHPHITCPTPQESQGQSWRLCTPQRPRCHRPVEALGLVLLRRAHRAEHHRRKTRMAAPVGVHGCRGWLLECSSWSWPSSQQYSTNGDVREVPRCTQPS